MMAVPDIFLAVARVVTARRAESHVRFTTPGRPNGTAPVFRHG